VDLNQKVSEKMTPSGLKTITTGAVVCAQVRQGLRAVLKNHDAEGYDQYRAIKYPTGPKSDTPESRLAACRFLFERARDILLPHYITTSDGEMETAETAAENQDAEDDCDEDEDHDSDDDEDEDDAVTHGVAVDTSDEAEAAASSPDA